MWFMRNLLFWSLMPFLAPQAIYVRKTAPRFRPADGPRRGSAGSGREVRMLAIGDSIIAGVGARHLSRALVGQTAAALADTLNCRVSWQAIGTSGYNSEKILKRLVPQLPQGEFDYMIVSVGVNDITGLRSLSSWRRNLRQLLIELSVHSPGAVIAVAGIPPLGGFPLLPQPLRAASGMRGHTFDLAGREVVSSFQHAVHVPVEFEPRPENFAADGFHPSEEGYRDFGRSMAMRLIEKAPS